jgi:hypothetical protein
VPENELTPQDNALLAELIDWMAVTGSPDRSTNKPECWKDLADAGFVVVSIPDAIAGAPYLPSTVAVTRKGSRYAKKLAAAS